ncbi:MAG: UDP-N-acetylmuramate--L-alanine ligase [Candidatus Harrisonbacteria bacterium CG10_big_fil_rev_8_21_14_0_10_40_38]|uniref:UDP-N-acetylmuramate--L-alanine ligase n=1 Tax=Candidatus Harrisonbacteria bacterium CG10_big_fil_rev_8_21_14_0_10_40_38 TaxID=1974583 RepID=A0A2H0UT49_9BACT|nr:MAG: UDP-N-acetylmuramate--L-alanine ligase [Candidatus Harrisonbacteria bacterium CG10_big_fil_rev_8_21_14_0_10_40_38]
MDEPQIKKVHFVGIGGIGISALARYYLSEGWKVSGSDISASDLTRELEAEGVLFRLGQEERNIPPDLSLVIYSAAVPKTNPERKAAEEINIKTLSYAQAIGELTKKYFTIAVSGSHGKSTTTSLLSLILIKAGFDPTVIVGTKLREFKGKNFRKGKSQYLVLEADEWNKSFHNYHPQMIVLTNIDAEHLDTYKNYEGVVSAFEKYIKKLPKKGVLFANAKDKGMLTITENLSASRRTKTKNSNLKVVWYNKENFEEHPLQIPGKHNQLDAEAAWQAAKYLGVKESDADMVFSSFKGAWRRMELLKKKKAGFTFYSDYAHHPTEIKATLSALRGAYKDKKIICIFQPHQQDRLTRLFSDFLTAFRDADEAVIVPIYKVAGREEKQGTDAFSLVQKIKEKQKNVFYAPTFEDAVRTVRNRCPDGGVVVFMGAGNIDEMARKSLG